MRVPISPDPCNIYFPFLNKIVVILIGMKWYLIVVLTCISLGTNDVERVFICLLPICMSSLQKCPSSPLSIFKLSCLSFCHWVVRILYVFCILSSLSYIQFRNIFFCSDSYLFPSLIILFVAQKFLILITFNLSVFLLFCSGFWFNS